MENLYLEHHGVKGMRWGVRRYQNKDGTLTVAGKKRNKTEESSHDDYTKVHSKKNVNTMSDAELRACLNRLQMEKQYKQLSSETTSRGKAYASKIMKAGTTVAGVTTTAITIYNNFDKIKAIIEKTKK